MKNDASYDNSFKEFHKTANDEVNEIIAMYNAASRCLDDLIENY